jgi:RimJ/RimL family protein N-acetyltransferase
LLYPIETVRLTLTPFEESDIDALYVMERDPEVKRYAGGVLSRPQAEKLLKQFIESVSETGWGAVAIKARATNQIVGLCGLYATDHPQEGEIFFGLAREAWGQGYATEAAGALALAGIRELGLSTIIATVHPENTRSIRVLEKVGMSFSHLSTASELYAVEHVYHLKAERVR